MDNYLIKCVTGLSVAVLFVTPLYAERVAPPPVPPDIQVPAGNRAFLVGHAIGTQNYICVPATSGVAWTLVGPQATLFSDDWGQTTTHFLSPNPQEGGMARATWQHSRDTSAVWAAAIASVASPAPASIPWLLLKVMGAQRGPEGGDKLTRTTFIHRLNTRGGVAPAAGCVVPGDVGKRVFVPYVADYFFYKDRRANDNDNDEDD